MPESDLSDRLAAVLEPIRLRRSELSELWESLQHHPTQAIRVSSQASAAPPFHVEPVAWYPRRGRRLTAPARPAGWIEHARGDYYVQDAGSMLALAALDARDGEALCDLCAAPGGKATALAEAVVASGLLLANEPIRSRLGALRLNLARGGTGRYAISCVDPRRLAARLAGRFDGVLADVPCTGQTMLRRGKRPAAAFSPRHVRHSAARQARILSAAADLVAPGGRLVYSTCTLSWNENEQRVTDFVSDHEGWQIEPVEGLSPWQSPPPAPRGCYRLWPHRDDCAGAFAARLRRSGGAAPPRPAPPARLPHAAAQGPNVHCGGIDIGDWGQWRGPVTIRSFGPRCWALPGDWPAWLADGVEGPEVAYRPGERSWQPAYALAMRRDGAFEPHRRVDLTESDAKAYLRGLSVPGDAVGWAVATFGGGTLGWVKGGGGRLTNHLPRPARCLLL